MVVDVVSSSGTEVDVDATVDGVVEPEGPERPEPPEPDDGVVTWVVAVTAVAGLGATLVTAVDPVDDTASVCTTGAGGSAVVPFRCGDTKAGEGSVLTWEAAARATTAPRKAAAAARAMPTSCFFTPPLSAADTAFGIGRWS